MYILKQMLFCDSDLRYEKPMLLDDRKTEWISKYPLIEVLTRWFAWMLASPFSITGAPMLKEKGSHSSWIPLIVFGKIQHM
ncbi:hypothetical protein HAX54_023187 [Datura stramonium]|uniref:Uncharacterized protein n=1 Tax=Datura stramonium TaxID=4076 RepID=A0ABS8UYC3_DATST|nr:hypothetical protein [Datura stramonium]